MSHQFILLHSWIHTPMAHALGWTLFHFLWEGAAIAAVLLAILLLFRTASPRIRYAAACLALLSMPLVFAITFALMMPASAPHPAVSPARIPVIDPLISTAATSSAPASPTLADRLAWASPIWLAGVLALFLYRFGAWLAAERLRRVGAVAAPIDWHYRLQSLAKIAGIARPIALLESCLADTPMVIGYLKPAIVAPLGMLAGLPSSQVEAILLHELAHIRRADYLVNLLQAAVEGLLFYHPAVWWISSVIRSERENCCDDWAAMRHGDAHAYARALVTLEQSPWRTPDMVLAATGGNLLRRIRRLLSKPEPRDLALPILPAAFVVLFAAASLAAFIPDRPAPAPKPAPAPVPMAAAVAAPVADPAPRPLVAEAAPLPAPVPPPQTEARTPYQKWLNEDAAYIITPEERTAFRALQTDDEREKFIEQFWDRRNPIPGSSRNEFKEEHYRRIAYSNEHFAPANFVLPGWKTNRGRTYIVYGPPDEIDDHTNDVPPTQTWRYRYIDGIGFNAEFLFTINFSGETRQLISPPPVATFTGKYTTVAVHPGGLVDYSISVDLLSGSFRAVALVTRADGADFNGDVFLIDALSGTRQQTLHNQRAPGSYVVTLTLTERTSGRRYTDTVSFTVQ